MQGIGSIQDAWLIYNEYVIYETHTFSEYLEILIEATKKKQEMLGRKENKSTLSKSGHRRGHR